MTPEVLQKILHENLKGFKLTDDYGQRSVGDKIEYECSNISKRYFGDFHIDAKSKRSIEDFSIVKNNQYNFFDVKTHYVQDVNGFSMPNLISVKRLKKLLETNSQSLSYIFVDYTRKGGNVIIEDVIVKYIWELDWSILSIGALGKGQLQIKDANKKLTFTCIGKQKWFEILKSRVNEFYQKEILKINKELKSWI